MVAPTEIVVSRKKATNKMPILLCKLENMQLFLSEPASSP